LYSLTAADRSLYENGTLSTEGLRAAMERRDPRLAEYLVKLVLLDPAPEALLEAAREHRPNYLRFISQAGGRDLIDRVKARDPTLPGQPGYSRLKRQKVIATVHHEGWAELEAPASIGHLPDRLSTHQLIEALWEDNSAYSRAMLLEVIAAVPLRWGPWRALKRIFKRAVARGDWTIFAALFVRLSAESVRSGAARPAANAPLVVVDEKLHHITYSPRREPPVSTRAYGWGTRAGGTRDVRPRTIQYLMRRARRILEGLARNQPDRFPFVAAEILVRYPAGARIQLQNALIGDVELWSSHLEPLMRVVELGQNDVALRFAFSTLETRFREQLKLADPAWILRLARSPSRRARRMVVRWFLEPVCGYEIGRFHEVGLQAAVMAMLDYDDERGEGPERWNSRSEGTWLHTWRRDATRSATWPSLARAYAVDYIKGARDVVASDLPLEKALWLMRSREKAYRQLGELLLGDDGGPSPYADQLTLGVWTELLEDPYTHAFALRVIRRGFSGAQLSADWYADRLLSKHRSVREVALSFLKDETKYRADDDWLAFHKKIARSTEAVDAVLQRSIYQLSRKDESGASDLDGLPAEFLRMLAVHPSAPCHRALIQWIDGGRVPLAKLGVGFMKLLATREDWEAGAWRDALGDEREEAHDDRDYIGAVGAAVRRWLKVEADVEALGFAWALERVDREGADTDFLRALFVKTMPLAQLAADPAAEGAAAEGARAALERVLGERDADGRVARFYKRFLLARHPGLRREQDPNLPPLAGGLALPDGALTFEHFERMAADERAPVRAFAMQVADWELAGWTTSAPLSFPRLKPLLRDAFHDVRRYLVRAMTSPRRPEGRLDLSGESFEVEALYAWCFDARKEIRDLGMEIILRHPQRFGQPEQLLQLSESSDRRVREMVIAILWRQARALPITPAWRPNERSVVPQSASLARAARVVALPVPPPDGVAPSEVSSKRKYLGGGAPDLGALGGSEALGEFIRAALFQLPPVRQSAKLPPRGYTLKTAWRNKRTLIGAVRDLAVRDRDFAALVLPILSELRAVRGQMVSDAALVALAHLHAAHPDLNALGDLA